MAEQLNIWLYEILAGGGSSIDLLAGTDGLYLSKNGWTARRATKTPQGQWNNVIETIPLQVAGTSHDNLAANIQALEESLRKAYLLDEDVPHLYRAWLRNQLTDETYARQALIKRAEVSVGSGFHDPPVSPGNMIPQYTLAVERYPFWENSYASNDSREISSIGGQATFIRQVDGDIPARIPYMLVGSSDAALYEFWISFRSDLLGPFDLFQSVWECGDADISYGDDTTQSGTDAVCTFAGTATWGDRVTVAAEDVMTDVNALYQNGRSLVLLRARATGTRTYQARLYHGLKGTAAWNSHRSVAIPASGVSTNWYLYPLGYVTNPIHRSAIWAQSEAKRFALKLAAKVDTAGTGNLELDRFIFIPVNEGAIHGKGIQSSGTGTQARIFQEPDGEIFGVGYDGSTGDMSGHLAVTPMNWGLPLSDSTNNIRIIGAAQRSTSSVAADDFWTQVFFYERWLTLRGAEGQT